jgi:hypothetical protein
MPIIVRGKGEDYPEYQHGIPQYARLKSVLVPKKLKPWKE